MFTLPDPDELADFPELAALALLGVALDVSVRALVAANPELHGRAIPPDAEYLEEEGISPSTDLPFSLAIRIRDLAEEIRLYREQVDRERKAREARPF